MMCSSMSSLAPTPSVCLRSLSHLSQTCGSRRLRHERQQVRLRSRQEWARRRGVGKSMNEGTHHGNGKCAIKMHVYAAAQERRESVDRATDCRQLAPSASAERARHSCARARAAAASGRAGGLCPSRRQRPRACARVHAARRRSRPSQQGAAATNSRSRCRRAVRREIFSGAGAASVRAGAALSGEGWGGGAGGAGGRRAGVQLATRGARVKLSKEARRLDERRRREI